MGQRSKSFSLGTILLGLSCFPCVYLLRMLEGSAEEHLDDTRLPWEAHVALIVFDIALSRPFNWAFTGDFFFFLKFCIDEKELCSADICLINVYFPKGSRVLQITLISCADTQSCIVCLILFVESYSKKVASDTTRGGETLLSI